MRTQTPLTKKRIFDAAARLFADHRFHEVRMEEIAASAGVGKGTLYRYYRTKDDLYLDLIATASAEVLAMVESRRRGAASMEQRLEAIVEALISFFDAHPFFLDLLQHVEAHRDAHRDFPWARVRKELSRSVAEILSAAHREGQVVVDDPEMSALILLGGTRAVIRTSSPPRPDGLARRIVSHVLDGIRSSRPKHPRPRRQNAVKA